MAIEKVLNDFDIRLEKSYHNVYINNFYNGQSVSYAFAELICNICGCQKFQLDEIFERHVASTLMKYPTLTREQIEKQRLT